MKRNRDISALSCKVQRFTPAPRHIAIIMDGNGRWAKERGQPRSFGHKKGVEALRRSVRFAADKGVGFLTLYAFSSENWTRPVEEINDLLGLLKRFIRNDLAELHGNNVRVRVIGAREDLARDIRNLLQEAETLTQANTGLQLVMAFNYGARQEIANAARKIAEAVEKKELTPAEITAELLPRFLDTAEIPDPDVVIRTSGEQRLSNFLLWQAAYSELVFLPVLWPDFDEIWFDKALVEFAGRERRYGGLAAASG